MYPETNISCISFHCLENNCLLKGLTAARVVNGQWVEKSSDTPVIYGSHPPSYYTVTCWGLNIVQVVFLLDWKEIRNPLPPYFFCELYVGNVIAMIM